MFQSKKNILVIDDNKEMQTLLCKILEASGASVYLKSDVKEGLEFSQKNRPDLVLLDLNLPKHSGFDFLKLKDNFSSLANVPIIIVSADKSNDAIMRAISLGANDYIIKPINATNLINKIRKQLKDKSYLQYIFPKDKKNLGATLSLFGQISEISAVQVYIDIQAKLEANQSIRVKSNILTKLGLENTELKTTGHLPFYIESGRFMSGVQFAGLSSEKAKTIRRLIRSW